LCNDGEKLQTESMIIESGDLRVPTIRIFPIEPKGAAVVVHGYGGCKEEQLGLAWRVASSGLVAYSIDLRGHGQNPMDLDNGVQEDVELVIRHARQFGKVVAIGHSLGGRISLMSSADFAIGLSPPLEGSYGARTEELLRKLRGYRVRTEYPDKVIDILAKFPAWVDQGEDHSVIIYGSRDVPEIVTYCDGLRTRRKGVHRIEEALHSDTYLLEKSFEVISSQLKTWFGKPSAPHSITCLDPL
jgi:hypothetical protein